ncbi:cytochrome P450 [Thermobifida halotolerans]|uniref:Cytochrome P450 n=1 Tax=Thermobifida halotolerans TaxID=483545 RepID=A0A399G799_9ACTN|nr:cytochrome P450 [Thermobifida halotolerans]UOE20872.1 cytochrome P450 [Thermobifida halotolerans]
MSDPTRCPVVHFDHHSAEHADDPVASYRALRQSHKRGWTEAHGGYWVLSDYQSVFDAARDDDLFSSTREAADTDGLAIVIPPTPMYHHIPIEVDPPEFRKYRKIVNQITAPSAVKRMEEMVERYTTAFVDSVIEKGECDFTTIIGVPAIVTIDWLGLPVEDWNRYAGAHRATLADPQDSPEFRHAVEVELPALSEQMWQTIRDRRAEPRDDVISFLVAQEIDGRPITDEEVFAIVDLLVSGGTGTTASLVSQALVWLARNTEVRRELIDDPGLLDRAVEEFLRVFSPTQALARTVTRDVDFHGCPMKAGDRVLLSWASANRDEEQFDAPDTIDIRRWPNRHVAFGIGVHRCAGSHLGRLMAKRLLQEILTRMPDYTIDFAALERFPDQGTNVGFRRIPARFTPGGRVLAESEAVIG